jgi:hypothetical protein
VSSDFQRKGSSPAKGFLKPSSVVAPTQLLPTLLGMDDKKDRELGTSSELVVWEGEEDNFWDEEGEEYIPWEIFPLPYPWIVSRVRGLRRGCNFGALVKHWVANVLTVECFCPGLDVSF